MLDDVDVVEALAVLRRLGGEPERIEAKRASGGLPSSARETLSAFSNTEGGTLVLGLDESDGFAVVELLDPTALRDALVQMSRDDLTPSLQIATEIVEIEGRMVVIASVPPATPDQKPVYVTSKGVSTGSYLRTGDGDRRMTEAEIGLLYAGRAQPQHDREPVPGTSLDDVDRDSLARTLQRVRRSSPALGRSQDAVALCRLGVLVEPDEGSELTLAGLLTFGQFPQAQFPQLMTSVVVHPPEGAASAGFRFLDNATLRGSIPEMVQGVLDIVRRNLAARAVMSDSGRTDRLEFPLGAVREAVVNALMHRDYSGITRGTQVQVELHPDRLEVRSPGGIYGGIAVEDLGEEGVSSSRNTLLASLLSDAYMPGSAEIVAENRSSGVPTMIDLARENGLPRPVFRSTVTTFVVTMNRSQLLGAEVRQWINGLGLVHLTPAHEIALAMLRLGPVTNAALRQWGVDRVDAGRVLRDLVDHGVALKEGGRRYATYRLDPGAGAHRYPVVQGALDLPAGTTAERLADVLRGSARPMGAKELEARVGVGRSALRRHLNRLLDEGAIEASGPARSPQRTYRWRSES